MDRKPVEDHRALTPIIINKSSLQSSVMFGGGNSGNGSMKRSASELDFEEFLRPTIVAEIIDNEKKLLSRGQQLRGGAGHGEIEDQHQGRVRFSFGDEHNQQERIEGILSYGGGSDGNGLIWSDHHNHQSPTPKHPCISTTIDSQSSICGPASSGITFGCTGTGSAGSPTSALNPLVAAQLENHKQSRGGGDGASSGSDDDGDMEIEAGSCEQSMGTIDVKRIRRKVSNRESARRSRRRKQAHLVDLELQVDQLRGENASLFKQYNNASQHLTEAATDNRVLKSDVEALRVKVKLAEDMVARGSLTCSLNHLLQSYSSSPQQPNAHQVRRVSEISPNLGAHVEDTPYLGALSTGQVSTFGLDGADNSCTKQRMNKDTSPLQRIANIDLTPDTIVSEVASCLSEIWPWNVTGSK